MLAFWRTQVPVEGTSLGAVAVSGIHCCKISGNLQVSQLMSCTCRATGSTGTRNISVVCFAHPRRVKMVAQQIKREVADMLLKDKLIQRAIHPESVVGIDTYTSSLATISDVELSNDLQVAKIYVSIFSDEKGKQIVMEGLKAKTKYVRAALGKRMMLRLTPEVRFIMDESWERGNRVLAILDRLRAERKEKEDGNDGELSDDDDDNWEDMEDADDVSPKASSAKIRDSL